MKLVSAAGISPATSTFAEWRSNNLSYADNKMASVIGLAPIRSGLKGRSLDLLCIHGRFHRKLQNSKCKLTEGKFPILQSAIDQSAIKWSPRSVARQRLLGFSEALIYLSYLGVGRSGR